jgi:phosphoglycolate phosphatase
MKYKLLVFDLDGTLVNSLADLAISVNEGLKKVGLKTHEIEKYKKFVGNGREKLIDRAMGESRDDENLRKIVKETFDSYYKAHCNDNTTSYKGCEKLLSDLKKAGVKTAVLSNKPDEFVNDILTKVYPNHKFDSAWGKRNEYPVKPCPEALNAMLKELNVEKSECLYIGDSDVDVFTANNAEVDMLGVDWGFRGRKELIDAGAKYVASSADEILEYINEN